MAEKGTNGRCEIVLVAHVLHLDVLIVQILSFEVPLVLALQHSRTKVHWSHVGRWYPYLVAVLGLCLELSQDALRGVLSPDIVIYLLKPSQQLLSTLILQLVSRCIWSHRGLFLILPQRRWNRS